MRENYYYMKTRVAMNLTLGLSVTTVCVALLVSLKMTLEASSEAQSKTLAPSAALYVNVRRDTSFGLPSDSVHSAGVSDIVWGSATPGATLVITLTHPSAPVVTRTTTVDSIGNYAISVDRLIEDGDTVQVSEGALQITIVVPAMTFYADPVAKTITGTAPAGITTTIPDAPHSLQIWIPNAGQQVTTTLAGNFTADFAQRPYLAGLLGAMKYTTPDGATVYKPLFVADAPVHGVIGDWRADVILGQPDFTQITPNETTGNKLFLPGGLHVDRSTQPNRVYVYDSGNSRVLGFSSLGYAQGGPENGQPCTSDSDHPNSVCQIQPDRAADIVIGQPSAHASGCNGDSGYQWYPDVVMASAATLCGLREEQMSITEAGSGMTMATDDAGNLYLADIFNNRVLRYNDPFNTDTVADYVWGQADFSGVHCNRGASYGHPAADTLCFAAPPGSGDVFAGVDIDGVGNLWVADMNNHRVLRFPFSGGLARPAPQPDLVLGQTDFTTSGWGAGLAKMVFPSAVVVGNDGVVYVADSANNRILAFDPPFSNGMAASRTIGSSLLRPLGLEIDANGGLWVNDTGNERFVQFVNETQNRVIPIIAVQGGIGVDRDGNVLSSISGGLQEAIRFSVPTYTLDIKFLQSTPEGIPNETTPRSLYNGIGLEVAAGQLVYADTDRLLFWNNPWSLTSFQNADGVVGATDLYTRQRGVQIFGRMRADLNNHLWVIKENNAFLPAIYGYALPLKTNATPVYTLTSPLPLQGGGVFTWTASLILSGIDVQPGCDCLWLADEDSHRAFRIKDATSQPVVDVVLGQMSNSEIECNQGHGPTLPSQTSLCHPGALAFDKAGNLYLADGNLEFDGNLRLLEFDASALPIAPSAAVFGIPASRVFGRNGDFTKPDCMASTQDPLCGPWEPAFDSQGRMVLGFNSYFGQRFPLVYQDPLTNPLPIAALGDFHSMPLSARFDQFDNLYVLDHNRMCILIYRRHEVLAHSITGTVQTSAGNPIPGVLVETLGYGASGLSDASGVYTVTGLITGTYTLFPSKSQYVFAPITATVDIPGNDTQRHFVGELIQPPAPPLLFSDNFDSGASPLWASQGGTWAAQQGEYRQTNIWGSDAYSWVSGRTCRDTSVSVRMKLISMPGMDGMAYASGVVLRFQDTNNLYLADLVAIANQARIYRRDNGNWTQLAAAPFTIQKDRWYDLKFTALGNQLTLYVDGNVTAQANDSALASGLTGLRSDYSLVAFDDYEALCYDPVSNLSIANTSPRLVGQGVNFTATIGAGVAVTYHWNFGDAQVGYGPTALHTYSVAGNYLAVVTATNSINAITATMPITITDVSITGLTMTNDSPQVVGESVSFTATVASGTGVVYQWDFGDGGVGNEANTIHGYSLRGIYTAVVTATNSVGSMVISTPVTITDVLIIGLSATNDGPLTLGTASHFTATISAGTGVTYLWDFDDGHFGVGATLTHTYATSGTYAVVVTATNSLGSVATSTPVTIMDVPIAGLNATNGGSVILGHAAYFTATIGAGTNVIYAWDFGDGHDGAGATVSHTYSTTGIYTATVTAVNSRGSVAANTSVKVIQQMFLPLVHR